MPQPFVYNDKYDYYLQPKRSPNLSSDVESQRCEQTEPYKLSVCFAGPLCHPASPSQVQQAPQRANPAQSYNLGFKHLPQAKENTGKTPHNN